jgi:hypothetical protein
MFEFLDEELSDEEMSIFKRFVLLQFGGRKTDADFRKEAADLLKRHGKTMLEGESDAD